jgi:hypothetical protein
LVWDLAKNFRALLVPRLTLGAIIQSLFGGVVADIQASIFDPPCGTTLVMGGWWRRVEDCVAIAVPEPEFDAGKS